MVDSSEDEFGVPDDEFIDKDDDDDCDIMMMVGILEETKKALKGFDK